MEPGRPTVTPIVPLHDRVIVQWSIGVGIAFIAAAIRLLDIGSQPLWLDEGYSWWDAQQTLARLWSLVPQCDPHPPLYFLALKGWMNAFGDSSQALRAMSALLGVGTTAIVILAGREINAKVGWLAGLLFALTPFQIDYGREARPYALLCFGASLIVLGALRLLRSIRANTESTTPSVGARRRLADWSVLLFGCVVVLWTNNTAIFIVAAVLLAFALCLVVDKSTRVLLKPLLVCAAIIFALWLPYIPVVLAQAHGVINDFWIPPPSRWYVTDELSGLIGLSVHDAVLWACIALLGGFIVLWSRKFRHAATLLLCLIVGPILCNFVFSITIRPIFLSRAMIGITPAVVILMAAAVVLMRRDWLRYGALSALLVAHIGALYVWHVSDQGNEPWDRIARELIPAASKATLSSSDEIVLLTANELALPLEHALEDLHARVPIRGVPADFPSPGLHARYPSGKCAPSLLDQDLTAVARTIARYPVVYFVTRKDNVYDPGNRIVKLLSSIGYVETRQDNFAPGSLEVYKFVAQQLPSLQTRSR
jgi:mannosyltransferase